MHAKIPKLGCAYRLLVRTAQSSAAPKIRLREDNRKVRDEVDKQVCDTVTMMCAVGVNKENPSYASTEFCLCVRLHGAILFAVAFWDGTDSFQQL